MGSSKLIYPEENISAIVAYLCFLCDSIHIHTDLIRVLSVPGTYYEVRSTPKYMFQLSIGGNKPPQNNSSVVIVGWELRERGSQFLST